MRCHVFTGTVALSIFALAQGMTQCAKSCQADFHDCIFGLSGNSPALDNELCAKTYNDCTGKTTDLSAKPGAVPFVQQCSNAREGERGQAKRQSRAQDSLTRHSRRQSPDMHFDIFMDSVVENFLFECLMEKVAHGLLNKGATEATCKIVQEKCLSGLEAAKQRATIAYYENLSSQQFTESDEDSED